MTYLDVFLFLEVPSVFLDAFSHLYKKVCPSVGLSVMYELNF